MHGILGLIIAIRDCDDGSNRELKPRSDRGNVAWYFEHIVLKAVSDDFRDIGL